MSDHSCPVVQIELHPHPNADSLSIVNVFGFTVVVRTADWRTGDLAVYVIPDSIVDSSRPEFAFLAGHERIKVKKLRGVYSMGLLVPAQPGWEVGFDASEALGITHYEPAIKTFRGQAGGVSVSAAPAPAGVYPKYDIENYRRYQNIFWMDEEIIVTEKLHGTNARYLFDGETLHAGSRNEWKIRAEGDLYWSMLAVHPGIETWCRENQGIVLWGEIFGNVQELKYGHVATAEFRVFDAYRHHGHEKDMRIAPNGWMMWDWLVISLQSHGLNHVPVLYRGPLHEDFGLLGLAEGNSTLAPHVREGCCVRPLHERWNDRVGRVHLKIVGNGYLEKAK